MICIEEKKRCSGCFGCANICPTDAIDMVADREGFWYPKVDLGTCIHCNKCEKACPYINDTVLANKEELSLCFAGYSKCNEDRAISSSGGLFITLAKSILTKKGIVYGAAFDENFMVYHKGIESIGDINEIVGSKYVQSRIAYIYRDVKKQLMKQREVMFVGTTCQIAGLKGYLKKEYPNLLCVDFICLGIPSPQIWKDYLKTYFGEYKILNINFKDKSKGWHNFSLRISCREKEFVKEGRRTRFFTGYFKGLYSRPSCSECIFKKEERVSDITVADCWGSHTFASELDDNKGLSSIVIHSSKGLAAFREIQSDLKYKEISLSEIKKYNDNYYIPKSMGKNRNAFWADYQKFEPKKVFEKYCKPEPINILRKIKNRMRKELKRIKR